MCGEHFIISARGLGKTGSSPHVRGALMPDQTDVRQSGIIPACAGSTTAPSEPKPAPRDHPRMCGEHDASEAEEPSSLGSSPHVRGAPAQIDGHVVHVGIIPACAGSTSMSAAYLSLSRDHPRMCGEHTLTRVSAILRRGSSPHVRGAPSFTDIDVSGAGIIPACAGSTASIKTTETRWRDHPRMCGEHSEGLASALSRTGSSPHVRGAQ